MSDEFIEQAKKAVKLPKFDDDPVVSEALAYTDLCEPLLREYHTVTRNLATLEEIKDGLRKRIIELAKERRGVLTFGSMTLFLKPRRGNVTFDVEKYVVDQCGEAAWKEVEQIREGVKKGNMTSMYFKAGKESVNVEVAESGELPEV